MVFLLALALLVVVGLGWLLLTRRHEDRDWPLLARADDRSRAEIAHGLLNDHDIPNVLQSDSTMDGLYGLPNLANYLLRVPSRHKNDAENLLRERNLGDLLINQG